MNLKAVLSIFIWLMLWQVAHAQDEPVVITQSFLGKPLVALRDKPAIQSKKDSLLRIAQVNFHRDPKDLNNIIWYGRRLAYLTRYPAAIQVYTEGLEHHPNSPELYRHRGHRHLSMRAIDAAISDFNTAAQLVEGRKLEIEPDGIPNKINQPLSSLQFNIYYHLGLAHYLQENWDQAILAYQQCLKYSINDDLLVATTDWLFMTYRRAGLKETADELLSSIGDDLNIIENDSYYKRLKFYQGKITEDELLRVNDVDASLALATQGYGLGNWYFYHDNRKKAKSIFNKVIDSGYWPAFGYLAAEADLSRMMD